MLRQLRRFLMREMCLDLAEKLSSEQLASHCDMMKALCQI